MCKQNVIKPKLLFIITGLGLGGAERQLCALADAFYQKNYDVKIISLTDGIICRPVERNISITSLRISKKPLSFLRGYIQARKIVSAYKPSIVHSHMFHANIFSRLLRLTIKIPCLITTAHNKNEGGKRRMLAYRMTNCLSNMSTNVSQEAVDSFISQGAFNKNNIIPVYNGIDINKFHYNALSRRYIRTKLAIEQKTPLLLAVGRLTEAKDYPNLLYAFSLINVAPLPVLAIIGAGALENSLKELAKKLNIEQRIFWLGAQHDVEKWYSACDLFVLSSQWEGFGLVVAEAMASETLVVVTNAGGVAEIVDDDEFIVPISNSSALAEKINQVLVYDKIKADYIKKNNRKKIVEKFSLESVVQKWLRLYKIE